MENPDYRFFDADNHYYEPPNCFVDWVEPRYRERALRRGPPRPLAEECAAVWRWERGGGSV